LQKAENDLFGLRSPISILIISERSSLTSVIGGYLPNNIQPEKNKIKAQKAYAALSLEKISKEIYSKVKEIDFNLEKSNDQLCHGIAILQGKNPILFENINADIQGVNKIWKLLGETPETKGIYHYFCAKLASSDKNYLFMPIIQNIKNNIGNR